jgi:hypothetical protein
MNGLNIVYVLGIFMLATNTSSQTNSFAVDFSKEAGWYDPAQAPLDKTNKDGTLACSCLGEQPDLTFIVHCPQPCPPKYALSISNTNLFSAEERAFLAGIWSKYRTRGTNGSADSIRTKAGNGFDVMFNPGGDWKRGRTVETTNGGFEVKWETMHSDSELQVQQVKHWQLNGIRLQFYGERGGCLLHFVDDKAVGDWYDWSPSGELRLQAKFNKPYALFEEVLMVKGIKP